METNVFYANSIEMNIQFFDSQINFKHELNDGTVASDVTISMSPQELKALGMIIQDAVTTYESQFGEMKLPEREDETDTNE